MAFSEKADDNLAFWCPRPSKARRVSHFGAFPKVEAFEIKEQSLILKFQICGSDNSIADLLVWNCFFMVSLRGSTKVVLAAATI